MSLDKYTQTFKQVSSQEKHFVQNVCFVVFVHFGRGVEFSSAVFSFTHKLVSFPFCKTKGPGIFRRLRALWVCTNDCMSLDKYTQTFKQVSSQEKHFVQNVCFVVFVHFGRGVEFSSAVFSFTHKLVSFPFCKTKGPGIFRSGVNFTHCYLRLSRITENFRDLNCRHIKRSKKYCCSSIVLSSMSLAFWGGPLSN